MTPSPPAPAARPSPRWHRFCGWFARWCIWGIGALPGFVSYAMADVAAVGVAAFAFCRDRKGRRSGGIHRNLRVVLRERRTAREHRFLLWRWARHMTHLTVDFSRMQRLRADNVRQTVDVREIEPLMAEVREGRRVIVATGHVGVPDLASYVTALLGVPITAIYGETQMQPVTAAVTAHRERSGQEVINKLGALAGIRDVLRRGRVLGIACDVSAKRNSIFAPFLGTAASTNYTPAVLHRSSKAAIAVITCQRTGRGRFAFRLWDLIEHSPEACRDAWAATITRRINDALSHAILSAPEQWWWQGRRFRHRPPDEQPLPDGLPPTWPEPSPRFF